MEITDIKIRKLFNDNRLSALVSITIDNAIAIHDIKVIKGPERLFVAMPSRRDDKGVYRDVAHPITAEARNLLEKSILQKYEEELAKIEAEAEIEAEQKAATEEE